MRGTFANIRLRTRFCGHGRRRDAAHSKRRIDVDLRRRSQVQSRGHAARDPGRKEYGTEVREIGQPRATMLLA